MRTKLNIDIQDINTLMEVISHCAEQQIQVNIKYTAQAVVDDIKLENMIAESETEWLKAELRKPIQHMDTLKNTAVTRMNNLREFLHMASYAPNKG